MFLLGVLEMYLPLALAVSPWRVVFRDQYSDILGLIEYDCIILWIIF